MGRRDFLTRASTAVAGTTLLSTAFASSNIGCATSRAVIPAKTDTGGVVRAAFLRPKGKYWLGWPGTSYDVEGRMRDCVAKIKEAEKELGLSILIEEEPLYNNGAVARFIESVKASNPDGVLLIPLHMNTWTQVTKICDAGLPTVVFAPIGMSFTGHIKDLSKKQGVYVASTMDFDAAKYGLRMIWAMRQMKRDTIVVLRGDKPAEDTWGTLGTRLRTIPRQQFADEIERVGDAPEAREIAREYTQNARKIVEPSPQDVINSAQVYLAARNMLEAEGASGITVDCLGLLGERKVFVTPCLAWSKLLDEGVPAACEADTEAVMTFLMLQRLFDKPGFMQDPVADTVRNVFIGAHCTSPTRLNGIHGPQEPFILRSHSESDITVSMQVLWREGQRITITKFQGPEQVLVGTATVRTNINTPPAGGCRTSVETDVDDVPEAADVKGFHQVFVYGDEHARQLRAFCQMAGLKSLHL